jgi:predicted nucleic acid-binding protein
MAHLLDTNIVLYQLAGMPSAVSLVADLAPQGIALSIVTYMEVYQSTLRAADPPVAQAELAEYLASVPVLPFSEATARRCAVIREQLHNQGKRVRQRALDLLIAATALEHDLTLVTRNRDDFEDVPGLMTRFYEP